MTEFVGKSMFGERVVCVAGNDGSCIISCQSSDDDEDNNYRMISIHKYDVQKLAAWLASVQQKDPMTPQQINIKCAEAMGWVLDDKCWCEGDTVRVWESHWNPYAFISDAWVLVGFASKGGDFILDNSDVPGKWMASFFLGEGKGWIDDVADTAPAAICLAFLKLLEARKDAK